MSHHSTSRIQGGVITTFLLGRKGTVYIGLPRFIWHLGTMTIIGEYPHGGSFVFAVFVAGGTG